MNENGPAIRPDEPLNRRACAVDRETITVRLRVPLTVAHPIGRALLVELHTAFAEAEQRPLRQQEGHAGRIGAQSKSLHDLAFGGLDDERWRSFRVSNCEI